MQSMRSLNQSDSKLILAIGMVDSVHFGRWLNETKDLPSRFVIFPSGPNRRVHPSISNLVSTNAHQFKLSKILMLLSLPIWVLDKFFFGRLRAVIISSLLKRNQFDVIHFHEMQSGGYPLMWVSAGLLSKTKVLYTPYGSDMFWFQHDHRHLPRIRQTLRLVDGMFPECKRDGELALKYGFKGEILATMPASGAFRLDERESSPIASRSKIVVKGYGGTWGRAIIALRSLEAVQEDLTGYEIHLTSVTSDVAREVKRLQSESTLSLVSHPKFSLSSEEVRSLLSQSKFHIALSVSDGFPASLTEALACGAIPIQSDTACLPESLVAIAPDNFVSTENWEGIGKVLLGLAEDSARLRLLSAMFTEWAKNQALDPAQFRSIISKAYGITPV